MPELAVLLAYAKITLDRELLESDLPDDPALVRELHAYFPSALRDRFAAQIDAHPLRREILTTAIVNTVVNNAGITFVHRMQEETAAVAPDIVRAHLVARDVFDLERFWSGVEELDNVVPAPVQTRMQLMARRLNERGTRWLLHKRRSPLDLDSRARVLRRRAPRRSSRCCRSWCGGSTSRRWRTPATSSSPRASRTTWRSARRRWTTPRPRWTSSRWPARRRVPVAEVADVYFLLADKLSIAGLARPHQRPSAGRPLAGDGPGEPAGGPLRAHAALTADVLQAGDATATPEQRFAAWRSGAAASVEQAGRMFAEISAADDYDLAMLSVAMRTFRSMLSAPRG